MKKFVTLGLVLVGWFGTGCATMVNGVHQTVSVTSTPSGASVKLDGQPTGRVTPAAIEVRRGKSHVVTAELAGYEAGQTCIGREFSWWTIGDAIWWPIVVVDIGDGAMWDASQPENLVLKECLPAPVVVAVKKVPKSVLVSVALPVTEPVVMAEAPVSVPVVAEPTPKPVLKLVAGIVPEEPPSITVSTNGPIVFRGGGMK